MFAIWVAIVDRSRHTLTHRLFQIVTKIVWLDPDLDRLKQVWCRVGAFSASFIDNTAAEFTNISIGDPVVGFVEPTSSKIYDSANLAWWRKATYKEWETVSYTTAVQPDEYEYRRKPIARLPLLAGKPFRGYCPSDRFTTTTLARTTIPKDRWVLRNHEFGTPDNSRLGYTNPDQYDFSNFRTPFTRVGIKFFY